MQRPISSPIAWCMGLAVSIARLLLGAVLTSAGTKWLVGDSAGPGYRLLHFPCKETTLNCLRRRPILHLGSKFMPT